MKTFFVILILSIPLTLSGQSFSTLIIDLQTPGAKVFLDKVPIKESILSGKLTVISGNHTITASKDGYFPFEKSISVSKGQEETIHIYLDKDKRSRLMVSSNSDLTRMKIDGRLMELKGPNVYNELIDPGYYDLSFSEYGKIDASVRVYIAESSVYKISVALQSSYPELSPYSVGRSFKQPITAEPTYRGTTKVIKERRESLEAVFGVVCALGGMLIGVQESEAGGWGGLILGGLIGVAITPKKNVTVPDEDAIKYNQGLIDDIAIQNQEIAKYNEDTRKLILERQKQLYEKNAIKVEGPLPNILDY